MNGLLTHLPAIFAGAAWTSAAAGSLALAFGGAPLGVLLVARRMSLSGDALSHGILLGAAAAFLLAGPDPWALTAAALVAALLVTSLSSLLARTRRLPEDGAFAVVYLTALAGAVLLMSRRGGADRLEEMLFGATGALDKPALLLAAGAATATLVALALFVRGFVAESFDPALAKVGGLNGARLHLLLMMLVALNLVAGFRAFGALMTIALMTIPAASARFWARDYAGQAGWAVGLSALASGAGLLAARAWNVEAGAAMTVSAAVLFCLSGAFGPVGGLLRSLSGRASRRS